MSDLTTICDTTPNEGPHVVQNKLAKANQATLVKALFEEAMAAQSSPSSSVPQEQDMSNPVMVSRLDLDLIFKKTTEIQSTLERQSQDECQLYQPFAGGSCRSSRERKV